MTDLCRRTLLKGAATTCGVGLLAACSGGAQEAVSPPATSTGGPAAPGGDGLRASLVRLSEVPVGGAVTASAPDGTKVLVTRPSEDEAVAFSAVCPHEGCTVAPDGEQLTCPCHGSQFELSGDVKRGPAQRGLTPFPVRVMDGQVLPA
jgi:cytochrome b6-f complex iron-sulfur subunit